jgi:hypothetical protein
MGRALTNLAKKMVETQAWALAARWDWRRKTTCVEKRQIEIIDQGTILGLRYVFHTHIMTRLRRLHAVPDQGNDVEQGCPIPESLELLSYSGVFL